MLLGPPGGRVEVLAAGASCGGCRPAGCLLQPCTRLCAPAFPCPPLPQLFPMVALAVQVLFASVS